MPVIKGTAGTIVVSFRMRAGDAAYAVQLLTEAGFAASCIGATDDHATVEAQRWTGASSPPGEIQSAHTQAASRVLEHAGIEASLASSGVSIGGTINPANAIGLVVRAESEAGRASLLEGQGTVQDAHFLGSCFAFRRADVVLTAAHVVRNIPAESLVIDFPSARRLYEVGRCEIHPTADLALLFLAENVWPEGVEPFVDATPANTWGFEFIAFGFPEDSLGQHPAQPTARLFKGHFQRTFRYTGPSLFRFQAAEMSIPSPAGLSGGALFPVADHSSVAAIPVENRESTTYVGRVEEIEANGHVTRTVERNVVQYGVAVLLEPLREWLDDFVPITHRLP